MPFKKAGCGCRNGDDEIKRAVLEQRVKVFGKRTVIQIAGNPRGFQCAFEEIDGLGQLPEYFGAKML